MLQRCIRRSRIVVAMVASLNTLANAVTQTWGTVNTQTQNAVQQATGG